MTSVPASNGEPPRPADVDRVDLAGLTFAPSVRVLRRSEREIQIERGDQAVIVRDLPERLLAQLHRCGHPGQASRAVRSGRGGPGTPDRPQIAREGDGALAREAVPDRATAHDRETARDRETAVDPDAAACSHSPPAPANDDQDGVIDAETVKALRALTHAGFLSRTGATTPAGQPGARSVALEPDAVALTDRFGSRAAAVLDNRHRRSVRVHGTGRLAPLVAALLAAAGVGEVHVPDTADVSLRDVLPGGLIPANEGQRTALAAADAVRRARAGAPAESVPGRVADLVIATSGTPVAHPLRAALLADRGPHLIAGVWGSGATIGPLVVPGRTSCLHCADLHRSDRDPAWAVLAAQLSAESAQMAQSEVAVCALAAAVTAVQALAFLDGERPATADGTLEFRLPDWRLRRRHWSRHARCPCAA